MRLIVHRAYVDARRLTGCRCTNVGRSMVGWFGSWFGSIWLPNAATKDVAFLRGRALVTREDVGPYTDLA